MNNLQQQADNTDREVYKFYINFLSKNGYPPNLRQIAEHPDFPFNTKQRAQKIVNRMVRKGYLIKIHQANKPLFPNIKKCGRGFEIF